MHSRKHLVVVVPGIGGSVLEQPPKRPGQQPKILWDAGYEDLIGLLRHPERLSLAEAPRLRPVGLIRSRQLLPGWTVVHGYDRLVKRLLKLPGVIVDAGDPKTRNPNANVVLFGYDFRRSIVEAAHLLADEVNARLAGLTESARTDRVIVVAHSMGGLVARYWMDVCGGRRVCRALITLGTPHRGAPKALDWLVNGPSVVRKRLAGVADLFRQWPSAAQLLPRFPMIWDVTGATARYPGELPIGWLKELAQEGGRVHEDIAAAWTQFQGRRPEMKVRLGWSHPTHGAAVWDGSQLTVSKGQPPWLSVGGWADDDGDGTVPAMAAVPQDMDGHNPAEMRVRHRHGPLGGAGFVAEMLADYERWPPLTPVRGTEPSAAIGLDLEEAYALGDRVTLSATVRPDQDGVSGAVATASLRKVGVPSSLVDEARLQWDPVRVTFVGWLRAPEPGLYDVVVTMRGIPGRSDLDASDTVAVLAP